MPFKNGVSVSYSLLAFLNGSLAGCPRQMFWEACLSDAGPQAGEPKVGSVIVIILPFVDQVRVLTMLHLCLFYMFHCGSFFVSLIVKNIFC